MLRPTPMYAAPPSARGQMAPPGRSYLHHSMVHHEPYYYPSPLARLHNVSLDSSACSLYSMPAANGGHYIHPNQLGLHSANSSVRQKMIPAPPRGYGNSSYLDEGVRRIYANSSVSHSLYQDDDEGDDASLLLSTTNEHDALGSYERDESLVQEQERGHHSAPALCLTPRFLASKRRSNPHDSDLHDDIGIGSADSLDQILEESNHSLLRGASRIEEKSNDNIFRDVRPSDVRRNDVRPKRVTRNREVAADEQSSHQKSFAQEFEKFVSAAPTSPTKVSSDSDQNVVSETLESQKIQEKGQDLVAQKTKEYLLVDWTVRPVDNIKRVIVEGMRSGAGEEILWRSTAVKKALDKRTLQTGSGSVYKLLGAMDIEAAESFGFSATFCKAFKNGFPKNWSDLVQKHFASLEEKEESVNTTKDDSKIQEKATKSKPKRKSRSGTTCQERWNGPTPGTKLDLSSCERTRSGRVVVPSRAVAWWKCVRLYTTAKTPLEIRTDTPIRNQMDSPLAFPLSVTKNERYKTPNRSFIKNTPSNTSVSRSKFRTPIERKTPKLPPRSKLDKSKVSEITKLDSTPEPSNRPKGKVTENSKKETKSKSTDSDSTSERSRQPVRKVANRGRQTKVQPKPSESVVEIPDTVQKPKSPIRMSLVRSPYSYPAHRTRNRSRSKSDGANEKFRRLFDDNNNATAAEEKEAEAEVDSEAKSSNDKDEKGKLEVLEQPVRRKGRVQKKSALKVSKPNPEEKESRPTETRTRSSERAAKKQEDEMSPCVLLSDVEVKKGGRRNEGGSRERKGHVEESAIQPRGRKNSRKFDERTEDRRSGSEDSEIQPRGRRLRDQKSKPLPPESDAESTITGKGKRGRKAKSGKERDKLEENVPVQNVEKRSMRARKEKPKVNDGSESDVSRERQKKNESESESEPIPRGRRSTKSKPEPKRQSRKSESESSTQAKKVPAQKPRAKPKQKPIVEEDGDSDTDDEIFAARNRVKQKQDEINKTINRSLGLNRSQKSKPKKNDSFSVQTVNEFGEKEILTWTEDEVQRFRRALSSIPASTENYWQKVSNLTGTKSADECLAFHLRDVPQSVRKPKPQPKPVVLPKLVRDDNAETVRVEISGGKGTFKRKRQMQNLIEHMNQDFDNDYFNSTPWSRKQRRIEVPMDDAETPLPKFTAVNTPATRLALIPRSERKTPTSNFISPGGITHDRTEKDDLYIHRCVQQMRRKIGKTSRSRTPQTEGGGILKNSNSERGAQILMELSQNDNVNDEDSDEEQDDYFSDEDN